MMYTIAPELIDEAVDVMMKASHETYDPEIWRGYLVAREGETVFTCLYKVRPTENLLPWSESSTVIHLKHAFDQDYDYTWNINDDEETARSWIRDNLLMNIEVTQEMIVPGSSYTKKLHIDGIYYSQPGVFAGSKKFDGPWEY